MRSLSSISLRTTPRRPSRSLPVTAFCSVKSRNVVTATTQQPALVRAADAHASAGAGHVWFQAHTAARAPQGVGHFFDHKPVDQRQVKLGTTIRTLRAHLPTLLATPLPTDILAPTITLRLFPSTHPHLPSVTGRLAYTAALWTSPVAWGRVPVVGNVRLVVLSERMVSSGLVDPATSGSAGGGEKLVVRWKTCGAGRAGDVTEQIKKMMAILGRGREGASTSSSSSSAAVADKEGDFHGLFLFEFDDEGRVSSHTIEHVEEGNHWERMARVISVTDWLLGRGWAKKEEEPAVAMCWDHGGKGVSAARDGHRRR